ncbi:MAG: Alpha-2-macroglobulin MG1 domain protein [bacterium ADurb.Bin429]|nr:MAG: Alpha-2-macroglobulin MG1 domain protein [bacterium ADurb.Bin429]
MARWICCWVFGLALLLRAGAEVAVPFATTVLKPDGTPAVKVAVLVRLLNEEDGSLREDRQLSTDEQGRVATTLTFAHEPRAGFPLAYALIDAPGYALVLVHLVGDDSGRPAPRRQETPATITLRPDYAITGLVVGPDKQPVAGAEVKVVTSGGGGFTPPSRFNYAPANIATPALCAVTDKDGRFTLRGVVRPNPRDKGGIFSVAVFAKQDDVLLVGDGSLNFNLPPERLTERAITLVETTPLQGTVTDAATGKPLRGARISLVPRPGAFNRQPLYLMVAVSDAEGKYRFPGVPAIDEMIARAEAPGYGLGWVKIAGDRNGPSAKPSPRPQDYRISLRPMITVTGKVTDAATGAAIGAPPLAIIATYDKGYNGMNLSTGSQSCEAPVATDGTFILRVPAGPCGFRLAVDRALRGSGPFVRGFQGSFAYFTLAPAEADAAANAPLAFVVTRPDGVYLRLRDAAGAVDNAVVVVRAGDKEVRCYPVSGYYPLPATPGAPLAYRVERDKQELVPWTELVVDKKSWVQEVTLP